MTRNYDTSSLLFLFLWQNSDYIYFTPEDIHVECFDKGVSEVLRKCKNAHAVQIYVDCIS